MKVSRHLAAGLAMLVGVMCAAEAVAQNASCERLRSELAALDQALASGVGARGAADGIRRQRAELDRTTAYARSIGCQRQRFLIFGDGPPAQCGALESQIAQMQANLASLEQQAQRSGGSPYEGQRAALAAAFDANCRGGTVTARSGRPRGLFESLFGATQEESPDNGTNGAEFAPPATQDFGDGRYRTMCVRACDGYYFPISNAADRSRFETDAALCQASCPNAQAQLFVMPVGQEIEVAQSLSGETYGLTQNAFRYRRSLDPACGCRKPGQSWVEALADADLLVSTSATDIIVTPEKSLELSRPIEPPAPKIVAPKPAATPKAPAKPAANSEPKPAPSPAAKPAAKPAAPARSAAAPAN